MGYSYDVNSVWHWLVLWQLCISRRPECLFETRRLQCCCPLRKVLVLEDPRGPIFKSSSLTSSLDIKSLSLCLSLKSLTTALAVSSPSEVRGGAPTAECILDAPRAQKTRLVTENVVYFAFLYSIGRNPWMGNLTKSATKLVNFVACLTWALNLILYQYAYSRHLSQLTLFGVKGNFGDGQRQRTVTFGGSCLRYVATHIAKVSCYKMLLFYNNFQCIAIIICCIFAHRPIEC